MTETKTTKYVAIGQNGVADSKKYHFYQDCSTVRDRGPDDFEEVSDREARLMGLKVCSVCERRLTGGPTLAALEDVLMRYNVEATLKDEAWRIVNELRDMHGVYLAQRKAGNDDVKDAE